jgi:hypothetical protein
VCSAVNWLGQGADQVLLFSAGSWSDLQLCQAGSWCVFSCARQLFGSARSLSGFTVSGRELVRFYCVRQGVGQVYSCARQGVFQMLRFRSVRQGVGQIFAVLGGKMLRILPDTVKPDKLLAEPNNCRAQLNTHQLPAWHSCKSDQLPAENSKT